MRDAGTLAELDASLQLLRRELKGAASELAPAAFPSSLEDIRTASRVAIAGGPRTGKTTLAAKYGEDRIVLSTDSLITWLDWHELSAFVVKNCAPRLNFILEGVRVAHALRKGLEVDLVVWLDRPRVELSVGQASMEKATRTVFEEWARSSKTKIIRVL